MTEQDKLRWSDVWLLVSLYFCGLRGQDRLKDAIAAADAMNHAVINFEELSSALVRLEYQALIEVEACPWRARCTKAGIEIVEPVAHQNSLAGRVWQETEKKLGVQPWAPKEPLPHPHNALRYRGLTKDDYDKEVADYLQSMSERQEKAKVHIDSE